MKTVDTLIYVSWGSTVLFSAILPYYYSRRERNKRRGMDSAFHMLCSRYSGPLSPTAPTVSRLWETFILPWYRVVRISIPRAGLSTEWTPWAARSIVYKYMDSIRDRVFEISHAFTSRHPDKIGWKFADDSEIFFYYSYSALCWDSQSRQL